jgi:hypothetical protein
VKRQVARINPNDDVARVLRAGLQVQLLRYVLRIDVVLKRIAPWHREISAGVPYLKMCLLSVHGSTVDQSGYGCKPFRTPDALWYSQATFREGTMLKVEMKTKLQLHVEWLIRRHGGHRKAARALNIDSGYLWRIKVGQVKRIGPKTLEKLGLRSTEKLVAL